MNYAGDLSPEGCWQALRENGASTFLIDVRTRPEWVFVGIVETEPDMHPVILQEWQVFPTMQVDSDFQNALSAKLEELGANSSSTLCFICRSGVRSQSAAVAMTAMGYENCLNVLEGFEGDADEHGHRGFTNGWKVKGLPWRQT